MSLALHLGRKMQELRGEILVNEKKLQGQGPKAAAIRALV
jgi:hypothetical protein